MHDETISATGFVIGHEVVRTLKFVWVLRANVSGPVVHRVATMLCHEL